jgi:nanoRNase/pAp phosphatase (c-di-AMP/oligoRNAs hydrolase)
MALLNVRLYIKSKEKTMDVLYALKNYGVDTKNLFTQLKEKGYFELKLANELIEKLQTITKLIFLPTKALLFKFLSNIKY